MYERFTDRARKVMQLANQEAQRLHHEYIGSEHILRGLVKEGGGVAADVLKDSGVQLHTITVEVDKFVQKARKNCLRASIEPTAISSCSRNRARWGWFRQNCRL